MYEMDEADEWAAQFTRWKEFSKAHNLTKDRRPDHLPTCYRCDGFGKVFKNMQDKKSIIECHKCKGRGYMLPKPKYDDEEIREVVDRLGEEAVRRIVKNYRRGVG